MSTLIQRLRTLQNSNVLTTIRTIAGEAADTIEVLQNSIRGFEEGETVLWDEFVALRAELAALKSAKTVAWLYEAAPQAPVLTDAAIEAAHGIGDQHEDV